MKKGFTLLEILLVVGILAILVTLTLPLGLDFYKSQQLETQVQSLIQTLRRAQLKAMSIELDSTFGVYLTNENYILFKGSSYTSPDHDPQYDEVFDLPEIINVSGLSEVVFSKFEGSPNVTGNIILNSNDESRTININKFGMISLIPAVPPLPYLAQLHYRWRADDGGEGVLGKNWTQATGAAQWSARYHHTSVVFDNKMWVMGGENVPLSYTNDVWYSTSGISWTQATNTAQWSKRDSHTSVVYDNKIWVIGGNDGTDKNDVWYSTSGISWTQATSSAQWSKRSGHTSVVFDNKMWVIGGFESGVGYKNDVWYSTSGISWTQAISSAQWTARYGHTSVVFDNKIWVIGGYEFIPFTSFYFNDVWYSTSGISWTQATDTAQWSERYGHTSVTTTVDNKIWVIGGFDSAPSYKNDVWYSAGASWKAAEDTAVTNQAKNENVRVRFSIKNTGATAENYKFRLQFAQLGSYTNCTSVPSTDFSDVPTTTATATIMATSTYFADKDPTTNQLTQEGTFTSGRMVEYSSNQTEGITLDMNYFTEIEYNFQFTNNATATAYCLRVNNAGTVLNQYTKVATIYVNP